MSIVAPTRLVLSGSVAVMFGAITVGRVALGVGERGGVGLGEHRGVVDGDDGDALLRRCCWSTVPSLTVKLTVRAALVGLSLVVENWTERRTVCQLASVVVPVRARMPGGGVGVGDPAGRGERERVAGDEAGGDRHGARHEVGAVEVGDGQAAVDGDRAGRPR